MKSKCVFIALGRCCKKKKYTIPRAGNCPLGQGQMLGRSTTCKKDQKGEGVEKEVEKASMGIPQELIKKSQWNPVLVIIQESIGKI